jgi:hypothetical protein
MLLAQQQLIASNDERKGLSCLKKICFVEALVLLLFEEL